MVSRKYQFTAIAKQDLDDILDFIINETCDYATAKKMYERINELLETICLFPKSYPLVYNEYLNRNDIRKAVINNYVIFYFYDEKNELIIITRIVSEKRDLKDVLNNI